MKKQIDFAAIRTSFQNDGYVVLRGFLTEIEFEEIRETLNKYIEQVAPKLPPERAFYEEKGNSDSLKQLIDITADAPFFNNMLHSGKFSELAEQLLLEDVDGKNLDFFNKPPKIGKPTPPHQDGYYFMIEPANALTMWLPLERVDKENGCLRYLRGSHLTGMRPHGRSETLGFSQGITDYDDGDIRREVVVEAEPGDLVVHHALTVHRADGNRSTSRTRKAIGLIYYGKSATENREKKRDYQQKLNAEIRRKYS